MVASKRDGVIFTCLPTSVVEVPQSLSTDDFLKVYSQDLCHVNQNLEDVFLDFVVAEREIRDVVQEICNYFILKAKLQQQA